MSTDTVSSLVVPLQYLLHKILVMSFKEKIFFQYILNVIIFNFSQNLKVLYYELYDCICFETFDFCLSLTLNKI